MRSGPSTTAQMTGNIALEGLFDRKGLDPELFGAYDRKGAGGEAARSGEAN